jgi:hypothetical protein
MPFKKSRDFDNKKLSRQFHIVLKFNCSFRNTLSVAVVAIVAALIKFVVVVVAATVAVVVAETVVVAATVVAVLEISR